MFKEGWPLAPLIKYISIDVCTHKKIIKMMFINAWWLKQSGSFGKKIIMNKCNGTERNGRKDGFFARKACSVCVCSDPLFSISFHFIPFHSVPFHFLSRKTTFLPMFGDVEPNTFPGPFFHLRSAPLRVTLM